MSAQHTPSADVAEVKKCPCNDPICRNFVVPPLFSRPEDSVTKDRADEIAARWNATSDLLALAKRYVSECGDCNGSGMPMVGDPEESFADDGSCAACADIRAIIAKAEPQS